MEIKYSQIINDKDIEEILKIVCDVNVFNKEEIDIAKELLEGAKKPLNERYYQVVSAKIDGKMAGYICYAKIGGTDGRYELYWIAVSPDFQRQGIAKALIKQLEDLVARENGKKIIIVTSSKPEYLPARTSYEKCGYVCCATIKDYFSDGDDEVFYEKSIKVKPTVVILHEQISENATESEKDVLEETNNVETALEKNYNVIKCIYDENNVSSTIQKIKSYFPVAVFNLVETIKKSCELLYIVPQELEKEGIAYTGNSPQALIDSTNKVLAKKILQNAGLNAPKFYTLENGGTFKANQKYIIKPICEGGSEGISENSVVCPKTETELRSYITKQNQDIKFLCFADEFIAGEEYNVALFGLKGNMQALNPAKIQFNGFGEKNLYEILDYNAKWEANTFEYQKTMRTFEIDKKLAEQIKEVGKICANAFGLGGYARIDMRLNRENNKLYVIDINANPCIAKNSSGFSSALENSKIPYEFAMCKLVEFAINK